ncbi:acyl-CoA dehydrogenase [Streptomyces sp. NPDC088182]|uniref:acyl-CoA dehydrogenase n=1 Tax=Streptomyces sp. NPDC088182 TaxID=3365838 RepID=UPI00380B6A2B
MTAEATSSVGPASLAGSRPGSRPGSAPESGEGSTDDRAALWRPVAARFAAWVDDSSGDVPLPGGGRTPERFRVLSALGREDLCLARLGEGHLDATAILAELGGTPPGPGERWGVWAAHPPGPGLLANRHGGGWQLNGVKPYCSGAHVCTHALVTADSDDGRRLFAVRTGHPGIEPVPGTWQAIGMAGSDTPDIAFSAVPAEPLGGAGDYLDRPGFPHGGIGVAACWLGGAHAVADTLLAAAGKRTPDAHTAVHLGAVDVLLSSARTVLEQAGADIDDDPLDARGGARVRGLRTRALAEMVCTEVLTRVGRATGAGPLCHDARHAKAVADLTVYIRQHHAERDLAELGQLLAGDLAGGLGGNLGGDGDTR